jgi:Ca-activated chloride channel family protein
VAIDIARPLAQATISSPSHGVQLVNHTNGVTVKLQHKAWLDRDFVLTLHGLKDMAFAMASADATQPGQYTLLTSAVAHWDTTQNQSSPLRMKVLVDGSGSMQGDSNEQARDALDWLFHQLQIDDQVSMTRFGNKPLHVLPRLQKCTEAYQRRLRSEARNLQADLGGTELDGALEAVIRITTEDERTVSAASILLITDGDVWNIENIVTTVRQSGHRLFALGVGSSPAESLLRELAEVSGGACEMVSPKQSMQQAVARLLERMRHSSAVQCQLTSNSELLYESPSTREITQGDTLHQWAQIASRPTTPPTLQWTCNGQSQSSQALQLMWDEDGVLPRLCAAQRLLDTADKPRQKALALQYQLVTPHTNFILVHQRAEGEKAQDLPLLQQVAQMQAAGAGGNGTVIQDSLSSFNSSNYSMLVSQSCSMDVSESLNTHVINNNTPALWRYSRTSAAGRVDGMANAGMNDIEIPAFLRKAADGDDMDDILRKARERNEARAQGADSASPPEDDDYWKKQREYTFNNSVVQLTEVLKTLDDPSNPLTVMLQKFNEQAYGNRTFRAALSVTLRSCNTSFMSGFVLHHAKTMGSPAMVWAVLLMWLTDEKGLQLERHAKRLLEAELMRLIARASDKLLLDLESFHL